MPVVTLTAALIVLGPLGCFSDRPTNPPGDGNAAAEIEMTDNVTFSPASVTIATGQTVLWRNVSGISHTVTADASLAADPRDVQLPPGAEPFNSGDVPSGSTYTHLFAVPGTYRYFCIYHELFGMVGTVVVEP